MASCVHRIWISKGPTKMTRKQCYVYLCTPIILGVVDYKMTINHNTVK